jgi:hypothetical protein
VSFTHTIVVAELRRRTVVLAGRHALLVSVAHTVVVALGKGPPRAVLTGRHVLLVSVAHTVVVADGSAMAAVNLYTTPVIDEATEAITRKGDTLSLSRAYSAEKYACGQTDCNLADATRTRHHAPPSLLAEPRMIRGSRC